VDAGELEIPSVEAGVYRVEVYLLDHPLLPPEVPWIVSNPIFLGPAPSDGIHRAGLHSEEWGNSSRIAAPVGGMASAIPAQNQ
jgi:hypothetical protein